MPELPDPKHRLHPFHISPPSEGGDQGVGVTNVAQTSATHTPSLSLKGRGSGAISYAELHVTSNFTFLCGASHPEEYVLQARELRHRAIAITDVNSLAGIVRAHIAAKDAGMQFVVGCRVALGHEERRRDEETKRQSEGDRSFDTSSLSLGVHPPWRVSSSLSSLSLLLYPTDRAAYGRLCRLLTLGRRRTTKGECFLTLHDVIEHHEGLLAAIVPPRVLDQDFIEVVEGLARVFDDDRFSIASSCLYGEDDRLRLQQLIALSAHTGVPLVASNDVHYHVPDRRSLQDVLTCIRHTCTIHEAGFRLFPHAERCLKSPREMARLFVDHPQALSRTIEIADRARGFNLDQLRYEYPHEVCPPGRTPMEYLIDLTWQGAVEKYGEGRERQRDRETKRRSAPDSDASPSSLRLSVSPSLRIPPDVRSLLPPHVLTLILHEFEIIEALNYAPYFLTCYDIVKYARSQDILCQGRGAAANSAVCYCLGVTSVDPAQIDLLFERFVSRERNEPPDIDIDFEHERREEVIQYIYKKYGRDRAALTAEVITYRGRSAIRDVGKALGLSLDLVDRLAKSLDWWDNGVVNHERLRELGVNPDDSTVQHLCTLATEILGFPRHLSQHVGGFVLTRGSLCESVPIENAAMQDRTVIEWDKDDIDALGMLKVDVLGLGMLTCIAKGFQFVNDSLALHRITPDDPAVYDMLCHADSVGVFQVESRAQMTMLPRLRPRCFYDLVIEVAIVRPGPIQGDMVHPYLRRRNGEENVSYPNPQVERILKKTLGVPLFQEQAMQLAITAAGFTPGEADQLRRAIAAWRRKGNLIQQLGKKLITGMLARGYTREFAERCYDQIKGFSEYGFPESHAASFAHLVYVSAWLKCHYPTAFAAALLNSQPMGFYAPAQIVRDAQEHGVEVRAVDVNCSEWDCTLERTKGLRDKGREGRPKSARLAASPEARVGDTSATSQAITPALRLGMRQVRGLREEDGRAITRAVKQNGSFRIIEELRLHSGVRLSALKKLAAADAFRSMGLDRQHALWMLRELRDEELPLFEERHSSTEARRHEGNDAGPDDQREEGPGRLNSDSSIVNRQFDPSLPSIASARQVIQDYFSIGLSLKAHPISFIRDELNGKRVTRNIELKDERRWPNGKPISVAGLTLVRQRPGTASGVVFITIEDETGIANLIVRPKIYDKFRRTARHATVLLARGTVERQGEVVHVMVRSMETLDDSLRDIATRSRDFH